MLLAGCGSSGNHDTTNTGGQAKSFHSFAAAAFKYAECMRSHGVPEFPNPQIVNKPGEHGIHQAVPQGVGTSPQFRSAQRDCKGILPSPENGGAANAAEQHEHAQAILAFARCLRSHGVPDFPDPSTQGQLTLTTIRAAGVDLLAPSFLIAGQGLHRRGPRRDHARPGRSRRSTTKAAAANRRARARNPRADDHRRRERPMTRRRVLAVVALLVVVGAVVAAHAERRTGLEVRRRGRLDELQAATVERRDLVETDSEAGTA